MARVMTNMRRGRRAAVVLGATALTAAAIAVYAGRSYLAEEWCLWRLASIDDPEHAWKYMERLRLMNSRRAVPAILNREARDAGDAAFAEACAETLLGFRPPPEEELAEALLSENQHIRRFAQIVLNELELRESEALDASTDAPEAAR